MSIGSIGSGSGSGIGQGVDLSITTHGRRHSREPLRLVPQTDENLAQKLAAIARASDPSAASLQNVTEQIRRSTTTDKSTGHLLDEMA